MKKSTIYRILSVLVFTAGPVLLIFRNNNFETVISVAIYGGVVYLLGESAGYNDCLEFVKEPYNLIAGKYRSLQEKIKNFISELRRSPDPWWETDITAKKLKKILKGFD